MLLRSIKLALFTLIGVTAMSTIAASPPAPPVAPVRDVVDVHFGTAVHDPYRYMENLKDPEVQSWIKAQGDFARATLDSIPGRDALLARIIELDEAAPFRISGIRRRPDGSMYFSKQLSTENVSKFYHRAAGSADDRLLIDPEQFRQGKRHATLQEVSVSPDDKYVVFGTALAGSEETVLRVMEIGTGSILPESIDRIETAYTSPQWLPDSSGFVYVRRQALAAGAPATDGYKLTRAYLHKLHDDVSNDREVFGKEIAPAVGMSDEDFPSIDITIGSQFVIGKVTHGDSGQMSLYSAALSQLESGKLDWKQICTRTDAVSGYAVHGEWIYLLTSKDAPRYRVVRTKLSNPTFAAAQTVIPAGVRVVQGLSGAKDALYVTVMDGGLNRVLRVEYGGESEPKPLTPPGAEEATSVSVSSASDDVDGVILGTSAWTRAGERFAYDPSKHTYTKLQLEPRGKFDDPDGIEAHRVMVKSHDGVMVPLSIIHKKGIKLDGSHPTLISGYGAYGSTSPPHYFAQGLAWVERGGVFATAHVRGGGEFGKEWHLAGQKLTKRNTWKDFIACAQWLCDNGYTSPAKLAGQGGSAGGILIGRAITERPDLFAAAIISVGCTDGVRFETTMNGVPNIQEFGTVAKEDEFRALLEMSAYAHVVDGTKYPAVLLVHGINDPRVDPWMSAKMTARLQAATSSGKPVLFRVDYQAGHGIGSTRKQRQELTADQWSFLLWQFGEAPR